MQEQFDDSDMGSEVVSGDEWTEDQDSGDERTEDDEDEEVAELLTADRIRECP
jgi:hypothetical protein